MKKLLPVALLTCIAFGSIAQNCTPEWPAGAGAGIMPDSATNLPVAYETQAYTAVVQFKVPLDTVANVNGNDVPVLVTDITVNTVTGLDAIPYITPFTYVTNPASGVFPGGSLGCVLITGTPAAGSAGTYPIVVEVTAHATEQATGLNLPVEQDDVIDYYQIVVDSALSTSIIDTRGVGLTAYPVVTNGTTMMHFFAQSPGQADFAVVNTLGQTILLLQRQPLEAGINNFAINLQALANGCYTAVLRTGEGTYATKVILRK